MCTYALVSKTPAGEVLISRDHLVCAQASYQMLRDTGWSMCVADSNTVYLVRYDCSSKEYYKYAMNAADTGIWKTCVVSEFNFTSEQIGEHHQIWDIDRKRSIEFVHDPKHGIITLPTVW